MADELDAIVVGSGIAGGWATKELTQAGLRTLLLEAGGTTSLADWAGDEVGLRAQHGHDALVERQPTQRLCYACDGAFQRLFVSDREHPYLNTGSSPFAWIRGRHLGGRSLAWARTCFRLGESDFRAEAGNVGVDWPVDYATLEPWYRRVERWVGIAGRRDGLSQVPDSECLPSFGFNPAEELLRRRLDARYHGQRSLIQSRVATLTAAHGGRPAYRFRGGQTHPVQDAAHFSSLSSTLPAALATGNLTLRTNSVVARLCYDARSRLVSGVEVIDAQTREHRTWHAPLIILAASALESTRILLNSACPDFPDGLSNSSGCLGRYLMDHLTGLGAVGELRELSAPFRPGRPATSYVPRYRNVGASDAEFAGGYAFICDAFRPSADGSAVFRESVSGTRADAGHWIVRLWGFGECLPQRRNRVSVSKDLADAWGIPALSIDFSWGENELAMARDMANTAGEMLTAIGATNVTLLNTVSAPGLAIHEMGTARMGKDRRSSVVNGFGQSHDVANLFVVDGAVMPSSPCQNPSLTYMALASRAACFAAEELRKGNLSRVRSTARLVLPG